MTDTQTPPPIEVQGLTSAQRWGKGFETQNKTMAQRLRIAQIAPLSESVPPRLYGGTERVVSYLTEELVGMGHDVTLFASADSRTAARLISSCSCALRLDTGCVDPLAHHFILLEEVFRRSDEFDILHFHIDYLHFPLSRRHQSTQVTTLHGRLDIPDLVPLFREFQEMPLISISRAQRAPLSSANWLGTIHHGLPRDLHRGREKQGSYLAFLGRISPEKRVDRAIEIAVRAGMPLKIAAKVDRVDRDYFSSLRCQFAHPLVEFVGEIGEGEKGDFLGGAHALLFPIDWPEPFGLVMIEAMACGTPVIAWPNGSIPEIVESGVTGFIVESIEEAVEAVERVSGLSRRRCRQEFERRFSAGRMATDYVALYEEVLKARGRTRHLRLQ